MIRTDSDGHSRESRNPTCPKVPPDELDPRLRGDDHDSRLAKGGVWSNGVCLVARIPPGEGLLDKPIVRLE
jgi:hypothetical protein